MVEWLENSPSNQPSNVDVWGAEKSSYNFKDLKGYLQKAEGKGKKKAKGVDKDAGHRKKNDGHKKAKKQV
jgi:hypothetical protein